MDSKINEKWSKFRKKLSSKKEEVTEPKSKLGSNENESKEQYSGVEPVEDIQSTEHQQLGAARHHHHHPHPHQQQSNYHQVQNQR